MISHDPVLLQESVDALQVKPDGIYVDVTYGGGGHSREILKRLTTGKLVAFDQDSDAVNSAESSDNLILIHQNFRHLKRYLQLYDLIPVDGILADLGVSSHQLDTPERGFSHRFDASIDMRMDVSGSLTAREILNQYSEKELQNVFQEYGEVENAKTLAKKIVEARSVQKIETIDELKKIAEPVSRSNIHKYLSKVFQALRIEVNQELNVLKEFLQQSLEVLKPGGRLVVIAYHSLEDRLVKNFIKTGNVTGEIERDFYGKYTLPFKLISKKPILPSEAEIKRNTRARSAKMRVGEKVEVV